jgi:hypothetical protein
MKYLKGKRVRMISMEDVDPIQAGQCGVVQFVDDLNQLHVKWDDGRTLAIIPEKDQFEVLDSYEVDEISTEDLDAAAELFDRISMN